MIYDYRNQEGYVSLWVGKCSNYSVLDNYLSTVYTDEVTEQYKNITNLFLPSNEGRPCEKELKEAFCDDYYNQFEYDFGLSFDEDYRDANVLDHNTGDLEQLFAGFSYFDTFIDEAKALKKIDMPDYNAGVALYDFKYCGGILEIKHDNLHLYFLGYVKYSQI